MIRLKYTKHQVARGTRPDAEVDGALYLLKNTSLLHLTYQIRLLTFLAHEREERLVIRVPTHCRPSAALRDFLNEHKKGIALEKV